jgi:hypothetical protein
MSEANDKPLERARGLLRSFLFFSRIALLIVGSRYRISAFGVYPSRRLRPGLGGVARQHEVIPPAYGHTHRDDLPIE